MSRAAATCLLLALLAGASVPRASARHTLQVAPEDDTASPPPPQSPPSPPSPPPPSPPSPPPPSPSPPPPPPPRKTLDQTLLPEGRGFDWSRAGYREGEYVLPDNYASLKVYNVRNFGAKGNGQADDTAAIQAAVKAANSNPNGGLILMPAGIYILNQPITVYRSNVVIRGEGQGKTIIHIPTSLGDVYKGTWTQGPNGNVRSAWNSGGAFITFKGWVQRTKRLRSRLSTVSGTVDKGDNIIPVENTSRFFVGQRVRVFINDGSTFSTNRRLLEDSTDDSGEQDAPLAVPKWAADQGLQDDPVIQSAMEGLNTVGAEDEDGLTPEEAAAADEAAAANDGQPDEDADLSPEEVLSKAGAAAAREQAALLARAQQQQQAAAAGKAGGAEEERDDVAGPVPVPPKKQPVPAAKGKVGSQVGPQVTTPKPTATATQAREGDAGSDSTPVVAPKPRPGSPGTVAAYLYGDGMSYAGAATDVVDRDEVSVPAKVVAVGKGWIQLDRKMPLPIKNTWTAAVHLDAPTLVNSGLENLTVRFKHTIAPKHFAVRGYNGVQFSTLASCWIRNVSILNADNALFLSWVYRSTISGVYVGVTASRINPRDRSSWNGHHAISMATGVGNRIERFNVAVRYIHDLTVASGALMNVFTDGQGADLNLDHHRTAPWGNLFSNINMGAGLRPFASGGRSDRGAHSGRSNTYWNLYSNTGRPLGLPECAFGPLLNFVGSYAGNPCPSEGWMVQPLGMNAPRNIYAAQRDARFAPARVARG